MGLEHFFKIYWIFLTKQKRQPFYFFFSLVFMINLLNHSEIRNFVILSLFSTVQIWGFRVNLKKKVFCWYFVPWILIRESAYFCRSKSGTNGSNPLIFKNSLRLFRIVICYLVSAAATTAEGNQDYIEVINLQATIGTTNTAGANK